MKDFYALLFVNSSIVTIMTYWNEYKVYINIYANLFIESHSDQQRALCSIYL